MKKLILFLPVMAMAMAAEATIRRCNNNTGVPPSPGVYATAQAAHDAANPGDIIHLEPSPINYGSVTCTKPLTWISTGYFLAENLGLQVANTTAGVISTMTINSGSEGSVISVVSNGSCNIYVSNITIHRSVFASYVQNASGNPINNLVITGCYIYYLSLGTAGNAIVSNNIFGNSISNGTTGSAVITNNVINATTRSEYVTGVTSLYNCVFQNNILVVGSTYNFYNSLASYNITPDAGGLQPGNNNIFSANMANVVVNPTWTADKDLQLKVGSPAIATGAGGADRGAFGGSTPYKLGVQPAIPAVTALSSPSTLNPSTIQVTFSAKSNN